jgi:molecular chaperone DnaJ
LKDYYKILELSPQATVSEIKKNFRRLALRYHPDTNHGNRYAEAWYREIHEAYETLTNSMLRESYLQERWLLKSQGKPFADTMPVTPPFILKQVLELLDQVKNMDHFRMSHIALQQQILLCLRDENIEALLAFNDSVITLQVIENVIAALFPLEFPLLHKIIIQLHKLSRLNSHNTRLIDQYYRNRKTQYVWEKYQGIIILLITIVLCAVIYFTAR